MLNNGSAFPSHLYLMHLWRKRCQICSTCNLALCKDAVHSTHHQQIRMHSFCRWCYAGVVLYILFFDKSGPVCVFVYTCSHQRCHVPVLLLKRQCLVSTQRSPLFVSNSSDGLISETIFVLTRSRKCTTQVLLLTCQTLEFIVFHCH